MLHKTAQRGGERAEHPSLTVIVDKIDSVSDLELTFLNWRFSRIITIATLFFYHFDGLFVWGFFVFFFWFFGFFPPHKYSKGGDNILLSKIIFMKEYICD